MERKSIKDIRRADIIYCLKASSDYHSELCEECKFYPGCDRMAEDDMTEVTIKDLEKLEKIEQIVNDLKNEDIESRNTIGAFLLIEEVLENE